MKTKPTMIPKAFSQTSRSFPSSICLAFLMPVLAQTATAVTEAFTTPGTIDWVCPPGVSSLTVECRGGGGAGGSATRTSAGTAVSGGGAGGSYARKNIPSPASGTYKVIVGSGGVSLTTVATNGTVDSGQQGGASKFTDAAGTVPEIVLATGGAGGLNARVASNITSAQPGGDGSSVGCIGDVGAIFRGGNGGDAASSGGGGGGGAGDSADAADVGTTNTKGLGGLAGGGDGSDGRGAGGAGNSAGAASAPGGGGGGARMSTAANSTNRGGAGGAGTVKLTYTFASGLDHFDVTTTAGSPQTAGLAFDVTITAKDAANVTVNDSTSVVTLTSPAGSLMEFDWNSDGDYGDNSGTLVAGVKTIKARNKKAETKTIVASYFGVTTPAPASVTTTAAAFAKLQILAPGVTSAPGTVSGRSGTPSNRSVGVAFNATVNAVDEFWNLVSTVTDTVGITSTDGAATLPANAPLVLGTGQFAVSLNSVGTFTLTATDVSDGTKSPHTTQDISVTSPVFTWDAGNTANGTIIDPADGTWNTTAGNIVWNDGSANVIWTQTDAATAQRDAAFGGSDGTYAITIGADVAAGKLTFLNSGYTLSAASARTITIDRDFAARPVPRLEVAAGKTAAIGSNVTILGDFTFSVGAPAANVAGGTLNIESGAAVRPFSAGNSVTLEGIGTIINVKTGGFLGTTAGSGSPGVGVGAGSTLGDVTLNVDGGTVGIQGTAESANGLVLGGTNSGKGTVNLLNSGVVTVHPSKSLGLTFGNSASTATNTFNLDSGTLTTRIVREAGGTSVFNFNGGTLQPNTAVSGATFMTGLDEANVKAGGANINSNGFNITIGQNLLDGTGGGGLTKSGAGTLTLTGANTYTGPTAVNVGTLALVGGSNASAITVATGASLGFTLGSPSTSTAAVTLTAGTVAITGTVDNVSSYKLMTASSFSGPFTLSPAIPGYSLQTQAGNTELWLVPGSDPFATWAGPGVNFDDDANNDGVDNGLAWLLGAANPNDNALGLLPVMSQTGGNLKMTFDMLPAAARGTAQLFLEQSANLGTWSTGVLVPDATGGTAPVTFIVNDSDLGNPTNPLDVEATVSSSQAAAGKLFGRLKAVK